MKKFIIAIAVIAFTTASTVYASDASNISIRIKDAFATKFEGAKNVSWTTNVNFVKATFDFKNEKVEAFYNLDGSMIGTSRSIATNVLPLAAQKELDIKYSNFKITESIVFEGVEETNYYISLENDKQSVILKINAEGDTSIYKKSKKK